MSDYKLVIDTREQNKLDFRKNVIVKKLNVGDYGAEINGILLPVIMERKSGADFLGTLMSGHKRFQMELGRAYEQGLKLVVVVECSYMNFVTKKFVGARHSKIRPDILTKILHSTIISHDLEVIFCNDRKEMVRYIRNYFNALAKYELKHNLEKYEVK
jgi:ERCC4-type nuclease